MTFTLERLLFAFLAIASIHLYKGLMIEMYPLEQDDHGYDDDGYDDFQVDNSI
jgi:hypothetical protein